MKTGSARRFVLLLALAFALGASARTTMIWNEDETNFAARRTHGCSMDEKGLRAYVDNIARSNAFTHFFICVNAQPSSVDTKTLDPVWLGCDAPGAKPTEVQKNLKKLRDDGVDFPKVWIDECRRKGLSPFLSFRMNDAHANHDIASPQHTRHWREHPELWRQREITKSWTDRSYDYSHEEVRTRILAYIAECLERYDADGVEVDWMRWPDNLTPGREREQAPILTGVMAEIRKLAEKAAARRGHPVLVAARVSSRPEKALARGTDPFAWARAGSVDWIIPCNFYEAVDFNIPLAQWKRDIAAANPRVRVIPGLDNGYVEKPGSPRKPLRYPEYALFADRMYGQGADGFYLFNVYDLYFGSAVVEKLLDEGLPREKMKAASQGAVRTEVHD